MYESDLNQAMADRDLDRVVQLLNQRQIWLEETTLDEPQRLQAIEFTRTIIVRLQELQTQIEADMERLAQARKASQAYGKWT